MRTVVDRNGGVTALSAVDFGNAHGLAGDLDLLVDWNGGAIGRKWNRVLCLHCALMLENAFELLSSRGHALQHA